MEEGQLLAYIGTNGAGKSTTINMLTGLLKPSSGEIRLAENLKVGMVFQSSVLDAELSVLDNLKSRFALYRDINKDWFDDLLKLMDLPQSLLKQEYGTLSGGQKRRVDITRALLNKPNVLFLDEPTTGLDIQTREGIWSLLRYLQEKEKLTIFLTTHYLEEAEHADMAYIIDQGHILAKGSAQELRENYAPNRLIIKTNQPQVFQAYNPEKTKEGYLVFKEMSVSDSLAILSHGQSYIEDYNFKKGTINDAFLAITGREMA